MAIIMNQAEQVITLQTKRSTYQMKVGDYGVLLHLYYGARVEDCTMDYLLHKKDPFRWIRCRRNFLLME